MTYQDFLRQQCFIDGAWVDADSGATIDVVDPGTGKTIGTVPKMGADEARRAVAAAHTALPGWRDINTCTLLILTTLGAAGIFMRMTRCIRTSAPATRQRVGLTRHHATMRLCGKSMTITSSTPDTFLFANLQQDAWHQRLAAAQAIVVDGRLMIM